ncbi:MAG: hypothetical protein UR28_C0043G0006 [Candidatus Peregrinibacteria bacterium GW2011_GWF2_33_10]|nr:MAG: hypothetical protein UR28_C0043G0006 [Candidatus Peregrinibacteria bacterium GW2011_GWF2_33_10]OGJ45181.1 MAG: hypothetical protein A2263_03840 [Candidatus Peregrinibacteria bacterium RIFOXYA2_FULL_33_21]OGJ46002.1 MAG: hypothetical protein A2272_03740 [Candidatus Peregrinibacteria bacterium RIFOXYA12_FULL_33_12]OGJ50891.1 MAG: hypothetical protein A2307_01655 [Candidatus Peregrinibacteria bacterium RIFOXYB2_FULL_33_20]
MKAKNESDTSPDIPCLPKLSEDWRGITCNLRFAGIVDMNDKLVAILPYKENLRLALDMTNITIDAGATDSYRMQIILTRSPQWQEIQEMLSRLNSYGNIELTPDSADNLIRLKIARNQNKPCHPDDLTILTQVCQALYKLGFIGFDVLVMPNNDRDKKALSQPLSEHVKNATPRRLLKALLN